MQLTYFKNLSRDAVSFFNRKKVRQALKVMAVLSLVGLATQVFAAGTDLLAGTEQDLIETIKGTGKKYIYMAEGVIALVTYIATKNIFLFFGIVVISIFFNVFLKFVQ